MEKEIYVSVVAPVYNEENTIEAFHERLAKTLQHMNVSYEIIFVLDPCTDSTELKVTELMKKDRNVKMIVTSRRFGQPACTIAGIANCSGSLCFVIHADLQDPPELMPEMLEKWKEGYKVVYAKRASIKGETLLKRFVSRIGYYIIEKMSDIKIPRDTGDFRLLDRDVIDHIKEFKEHDAFLRGITAYIGFKQTYVTYNRDPRAAGAGKYNKYTGSLRIGMNGILNFSKIPLYADHHNRDINHCGRHISFILHGSPVGSDGEIKFYITDGRVVPGRAPAFVAGHNSPIFRPHILRGKRQAGHYNRQNGRFPPR